jgi:ketosteroid isomerase-like protein
MEKYVFRTVPARPGSREARGMVRDRIGIVRQFFEAWKTNRMGSVTHHVDPAVEVDWCESIAPYRGFYLGHAGWLELFDEIRAPFEEVDSDADDFVVAGQHVVVPNVARMRGRDGIEVAARSTLVFTFRGLKLIALRLYQHHDDALVAIGA